MSSFTYAHLYNTEDGVSHFRDVDVPLSALSADQDASDPLVAAAMVFQRTGPDYVFNNPAPRRHFVINICGTLEIEAGDGEVRRFGPGSVFLADDTTSTGHKTRVVDGVERYSIRVHLPD